MKAEKISKINKELKEVEQKMMLQEKIKQDLEQLWKVLKIEKKI